MSDTSRKWAGRAIQLALLVVALAFVGNWFRTRFARSGRDVHVSALEPPPDSLGPGDVMVLNTDSSVDLILAGDRIWAGLSPKTVSKIRHDMDTSQHADTGLGASIADLVKKKVAGAIGTHAVYRLAALRDVQYENGRLIFDWKSGGHDTMFRNVMVNGDRADDSFRQEDAQRFIAAVHARQKQLGLP
ncbi:MAG: hypothetical protein ACRENQ_11840 [Gemmatimonadaceae bacterium]